MLGRLVSDHVWEALNDNRPYDRERHVAALQALPGSWERERTATTTTRRHEEARKQARQAARAARKRNRRPSSPQTPRPPLAGRLACDGATVGGDTIVATGATLHHESRWPPGRADARSHTAVRGLACVSFTIGCRLPTGSAVRLVARASGCALPRRGSRSLSLLTGRPCLGRRWLTNDVHPRQCGLGMTQPPRRQNPDDEKQA